MQDFIWLILHMEFHLNTLLFPLFVLHFSAMAVMGVYGLYRLRQILLWRKVRSQAQKYVSVNLTHFPQVLVQIPLYNERFVASRIIRTVCALQWPRDRLEIQVLDDSTDETKTVVDQEVALQQAQGLNIHVIRREGRTGFKAGALAYGMKLSDAEFIAIFDADFVPPEDFLMRTLPYFQDEGIGFVQARWGFLNENESWFTRVQAVLLAAHFGVEQFLRYHRGLFMNFNGTAGVWRRTAIESAGGWSSDTVTEDLELSFRAYLAGWRAVYLNELEVPSELPVTVQALKNQQKRWAKGSIQTARKLLLPIWRSSCSMEQKIEATMHLLGNCGWILGAIIFLTLYPALILRTEIGLYQMLRLEIPLFLCATVFLLMYFYLHERLGRKRSIFSTLWVFFLLPAFGMGLAPSVTMGVLEGLNGFGGVFVRTPKLGDMPLKAIYTYSSLRISSFLLHSILFFYGCLPIVFALQHATFLAIPFLSIFPLGFFLMLILEFRDARNMLKPKSATFDDTIYSLRSV